MILWRVLPWRADARPSEPGGALWFPRELQGAGRHDSPELYGCLYAGEHPVSPIAEALAPFRGSGSLGESMLVRSGIALAIAEISLADDAPVIDLDDPSVLLDLKMRPSRVATSDRMLTQVDAARLFAHESVPAALRWWSTLEASFANLTVFDRAAESLEVRAVTQLALDDPAVREAADLLGLG